MRNMLAFIGLVVVAFVGIGYYLGWYQFVWSPGKDGKQNINVQVDTKKIGADVEIGGDKVGQLVKDKLKNQNETDAEFVGPPDPKTKTTTR